MRGRSTFGPCKWLEIQYSAPAVYWTTGSRPEESRVTFMVFIVQIEYARVCECLSDARGQSHQIAIKCPARASGGFTGMKTASLTARVKYHSSGRSKTITKNSVFSGIVILSLIPTNLP